MFAQLQPATRNQQPKLYTLSKLCASRRLSSHCNSCIISLSK